MRRQQRRSRRAAVTPKLRVHHPAAAGLDIGAHEIWACVPAESDAQPVRVFGTFTPDLHALADWLAQCQVTTIAMESTGVYWIPIYEMLRSKPLKGNRRAAQVLRLAAQTLGRTQTALGSYYRRLRARKGPALAITATAHKLARILYHVLKHHTPYQPQSQETYDQHLRQRALRHLKRTASRLGFTLLPQPEAA